MLSKAGLSIVCVVAVVLAGVAGSVSAASERVLPEMDKLGLEEVQRFTAALNREFGEWAPDVKLDELLRNPSQIARALDPVKLAANIWKFLWHEVSSTRTVLAQTAAVGILCAILEVVGTAFGESVSRVGNYACFLSICTVCFAGFSSAFRLIKDASSQLVELMKALIPPLMGLTAAGGGPVSAGLLHPLLVSATYFVTFMISDYVLPLLFLAGILDLVGHLSGGTRLSDFSGLLRQGSSFVLGCSLAGFLGVITVQRAAGGVADSVAIRTAKFMSSSFVPVVGKMVADATELVFLSTHTVRVGVGLVGAIALIGWALFPLLKVLIQVFMYRVVGALLGLCGGEKVASCLNAVASTLVSGCVALGIVVIMFVLSIALVVTAARPY